MNTISIDIEISDKQVKNTIFGTISVEMEATKTERGSANIEQTENGISIEIEAIDYTAARALTNSILRLVKASVDVVGSINISE